MTVVDDRSLDSVAAALLDDERLVHLRTLPGRAARFGALSTPLPPGVAARVPPAGLWSHQATAVDLVRAGQSVAVATGTASGKSLCFQLPIGEAVGDHTHPGTALILVPTKALGRDQLRALSALEFPGLVAGAYDGDSAGSERAWVRRNCNALVTNPEMLHVGLLPNHKRWATFLMRLRYVVVDELHVFRGIFGTHVAHLLRRLRRLCAHYGSDPTFVFTSATVGTPDVLASALCGRDVVAVDDDGSPRGERIVALWNPPFEQRRSSHRETARLVAQLVRAGRRTVAFCASRRGTELVAADIRRRLPSASADRVTSYRAGYLAGERREIEDGFFSGQLDAVVATTALELGIDVPDLDACVLDGFPGTIASMWQRAGRAGRDGRPSIAVLVAGDDQLDQWLMAHPDEVFTRRPEPVVINPANPNVLRAHLACAAYELPLTHADAEFWPDLLDDGVRELVRRDELKVRRPRNGTGDPDTGAPMAVWSGRGTPAIGVGLRSGSSAEYRILRADGSLVGTVDDGRAFDTIYPGAVYLHLGTAFRVEELDLDNLVATVEPAAGDTFTVSRSDTSVRILSIDDLRRVGRAWVGVGNVEVRSHVVGYSIVETESGVTLDTLPLDLPATSLRTRGFWYTFGSRVVDRAALPAQSLPGALHAAEHAGIGILPLFTICDRWDVGGVSTAYLGDTGLPTIVIYDGYPGGAGIADLGFSVAERHLQATLDVVDACPCASGCPSCVQSPKCGNGNEPLDKFGAAALLRATLGVPARAGATAIVSRAS